MWKIKNTQTSEYNKKETDSQIQKTNQWLPVGRGERQHRGRKLRGTNYYAQNKLQDYTIGVTEYII